LTQHSWCNIRATFTLVAISLSLFALSSSAFAQSKAVYLTTGERFQGDVTARDKQFLVLKLESETATIPLTIIDKIVDMVEERKLSILLVESEEIADLLLERINSGEKFETIVRKYSYHPSAPGGGNIGFVRREELEKPLSDAAFALNTSEVSKPIRGVFGVYLIKMIDKRMVEPSEEEQVGKVELFKKTSARAAITISVCRFKDNSPQARRENLGDALARRLTEELNSLGFGATFVEAEIPPEQSQTPQPMYIARGEVGERDEVFALAMTVMQTGSKKIVFDRAITANSAADYERAISKLTAEICEGLDKGFPEMKESPKEPEKKESTPEQQPEQPEAPKPPEKLEQPEK
jgi:hypothetical protein